MPIYYHMKLSYTKVIYNVFYKTVEEIRKVIQGFVSKINKSPRKVIDRLCIQL